MKYKRHQPTDFYAPLETIIGITRALLASDPRNRRAREFVCWADGLGHKPSDKEFEAWCKSKGIRMTHPQ